MMQPRLHDHTGGVPPTRTMIASRRRLPLTAALASGALPGLWGPALSRRWVGEQSGLSAIKDKRPTRIAKDSLQLAGSNETVVDSYAKWGFVVNGVSIPGSVLLLPKANALFEPRNLSELTPDSLSVLTLLDSPVRLLVIGCGQRSGRPSEAVRKWCAEQNMALEALPTQHACSTFNFMVSENRPVAAVMFPLES